jgi:predicted Zn finger-like uncharacterized protein
MFTVCPKCALTLVVTAEDLRVAQGYVRCGRCSSVFNALARLTEERVPESATRETAPPRPAPDTPERPPLSPSALDEAAALPEDDVIPEDALEFDPSKTDVSKVFFEAKPSPEWTAATGTFKAMLAANQEAPGEKADEAGAPSELEPLPAPVTDSDSDIDLELDPELLASILTADPVPAPSTPGGAAAADPGAGPPSAPAPPSHSAPSAAPVAAAESPWQPPPAPAPAPPIAAPPLPASAPAPEQPEQLLSAALASPPAVIPAPAPPAAAAAALEMPANFGRGEREMRASADEDGRERLLRYAWAAGIVLALLVLAAQIVDHRRDELAADARLNRPLTAVYAALGVRLVPRWDLHAYDVRQLGASVDPGTTGLITVRASIKNGAPQPQPLPLLRVTLQDRFGNRIAARDVAPPSYLPRASAPAAFLSAGQRIDAEMGFVDPGANAVGFEIDACLPTTGGEVTCANDASAR